MTVNLRRRVWDLPVRVTHALLIISIAGSWLTRDVRQGDLHAVFGYSALGLVLFRIFWGFAGKGHARFSSFAFGPRATLDYLRAAFRRAPMHFTGHNPAGSWAVFALIVLIAATALFGVATIGGLHGNGPLAGVLSLQAADIAREWHEYLAWAVLVVACMHLAGVAWGSWLHRENLAGAMVTGIKTSHDAQPVDARQYGSVAALILAVVVGFGTFYVFVDAPADTRGRQAAAAQASAALDNTPWVKECGSCHLAYPPALLPVRSWDRMLAEQGEHFGEDLGLKDVMVKTLRAHVDASPAPGWGAWKLGTSAPPGTSPIRITELPQWGALHEDLPASDFKAPAAAGKHDCEACHGDALSGIFHPRMIHNPKTRVAP